jgi:hypothetical protein
MTLTPTASRRTARLRQQPFVRVARVVVPELIRVRHEPVTREQLGDLPPVVGADVKVIQTPPVYFVCINTNEIYRVVSK